ncbi:TonB-dependent receptor plug domain-containing protein [Spirosoma utsteinense]|uniref:Outer membrane receptor for ferrienterochelin and colicin n=1 Tax=Spirosoma utsteinense TaxID=2585773 RepID=A0ABR6W876_9BACT|nr:TonB-dependent receptor [Spirosoma utsteinense]MBC3784126.1 outer membrane receptor for ferrienterochelin and colicin [Spirosoma utsteinense]MBC3792785.1 outer membrane receptor for ferrienterochelin and colicin [Spirosoma utsteinense]
MLWLLASLSVRAFAQTADLDVTVRELTRQQAAVGQTIYLENPSIGFSQSARTDANGKVLFRSLSLNGTYRLYTKENDTYLESSAENIDLRANFRRGVTLLLPTKREINLTEVKVSTSASRINTTNAEVSSELTSKQVEELPVEGRDITRVLYRLPNVSQATGFFAEAPNVSINGANALFNNYLIDGMDNNERFLGGQKFAIPVGFVRNVSVLTNNYSVEFGNTGNGIVNITSKSGSNQTTGEVFLLSRPGAVIDAQTSYPLRDLSGNQVKDGFARYQGGFGIGGALVKNKTFYYLNVEHTTDVKDNLLTSPQLGVNETVRGTNRFTYISGKIDQFWTDRFKSSLRVNVGQVAVGRQAGGLTGGTTFPSAANAQDRNSVLIASRNTYTTDRFASETNVQYSSFRWNYARAENPDSPDVTVRDPSGQGIAYIGHPGYLFDSHENTVQVQQKFSFYRGNHTFRAGAEVISARHRLFGGGNPNGSYTVQLNAGQLASLRERGVGAAISPVDLPADAQVVGYAVELRPASFGTTQNIFTAYVEDQISAGPRLNLTLGVRYDYDNLSKGGAASGDFNNVAPRASVNYKLTGRAALRGGVGIFYDKILYSVYSDALAQNNTGTDFKRQLQYFVETGALPATTNIDRVTFNGNQSVGSTNNAGVPIRYLQGPSAETFAGQRNLFSSERRILNPNGYANPYTFQSTVGYQYQVSDKMLFYADVVYNESYNLFRTTNLNAPAAWDYALSAERGIARSTDAANLTRPLPIVNGAGVIGGQTLTGVAQSVVMTEDKGWSRYTALSVNLQKDRASDVYAYRLIYTLSRLYNDTEDINFRAMDANNFAAEWGPSVNDRRHIINGIFNYYIGQRLTATVAALLQSGQPINRIPNGANYVVVNQNLNPVLNGNGQRITSADLNGDGTAFGDAYNGSTDRQPGESRNADRLPWSKVVDLSVQYNLPIGNESRRFEIRADVFNLLNTNNLSGYSNNATQSNQIQVGQAGTGIVQRNAAPPRQFQFGVRYLF